MRRSRTSACSYVCLSFRRFVHLGDETLEKLIVRSLQWNDKMASAGAPTAAAILAAHHDVDTGGARRAPALRHFEWEEFSKRMPTGKDEKSKATRDALFACCDANGNGVLSLAEFDRGVMEVFGKDYNMRVFRAKPAIMRAFMAAKSYNKATGRHAKVPPGLDPEAYVDRSEFRLLLV